jgi:hypothetical protein
MVPSKSENAAYTNRKIMKEALGPDLGETGPLNQGVQVGRKALRTRYIWYGSGRKKRPRGFK